MGKPAWEQAKSSQDEITAALLNRSASAAALNEWYVGLIFRNNIHRKSTLAELSVTLFLAVSVVFERYRPAAYADADACIKLSPKNAKGYFRYVAPTCCPSLTLHSAVLSLLLSCYAILTCRKAKALDGMTRYEEAFHAMQRGVTVEPENVASPSFESRLSICRS